MADDALMRLAQLLGAADVNINMAGGGGAPQSPAAYFGNLAQRYGGVPPDTLVDQSTPWAKIMNRDAGVWPGPPLGPRETGSATLGSESPLTHPVTRPGFSYALPEEGWWNDTPPTHYNSQGRIWPHPPPRDPWAMLKTAPLNQMFARRIPGLY
jgi:hypothetical protein